MSTTIALGYVLSGNNDIYHDVQILANKFGYGLLNGMDYAEADVRDGIETAKSHQGWEIVLFLQSPIDREVALAFGIEQELTNYFTGKIQRPNFFDFLVELAALCSGRCKQLGIFFAGECYKDDPIRYCHGDSEDLIRLLTMSMSWGITYLGTRPLNFNACDEIPLLFDLKF